MEYLFSYGTLRQVETQLELFGRTLQGSPDKLKGYRTDTIEIKDEEFLSTGEKEFQLIAVNTNNETDSIKGNVLEVTEKELFLADKYEPVNYKRITVVLASGKQAWIYVASESDL